MPGNINGDDSVSIEDVILALKIATKLTGIQIFAGGDLKCDNVMGFEEAFYVLQNAAGLRN